MSISSAASATNGAICPAILWRAPLGAGLLSFTPLCMELLARLLQTTAARDAAQKIILTAWTKAGLQRL